MTGNLIQRSVTKHASRRALLDVPTPIGRCESIFSEAFGGFWFEKYTAKPCPVPGCCSSLIEGWEYVDTVKDAGGSERLTGRWWIYCPACGFARKLKRRSR